MAENGVKLLGYWASPFAIRVALALKLKGIEYEYVEEDLTNKSPMLLQYNPVYKKVPVLVHGDKAVSESLIIVEYVDETWKQNPLLPEDPYGRAMARFWAKFADEKCVPALMGAFSKKGEEQEKSAKEARENLKILEGALEKKQFGGETIGYLDVAVGWIGRWTRIVEEIVGIQLIDAEAIPLLSAWFEYFVEVPVVRECLPPWDKLLEHSRGFYKILTAAAST